MLGVVGCSLSRLCLADFGGFALLAFALALLGLSDLSLIIFQRTTDTFLEVNARRRFVGKETIRKRIRIRQHGAGYLLPRAQVARRPQIIVAVFPVNLAHFGIGKLGMRNFETRG